MPAIRSVTAPHEGVAVAVLLVALLATWAIYSPGTSGTLHFDDHHNLGGLAYIRDKSTALQFVVTGVAGPLGRPFALATFAPQAYAWPHSPEVFLRVNVLIHLLNGALVTWFLYLLGTSQQQSSRQAALIGAIAAGIWMLMPILASSSLFIVQRMTTLSATFVLSGGIAYLYARRTADRRPFLALSMMTLALLAGAALGALTKENGVLLLVFVLVVEATLLNRPERVPRLVWRNWFFLLLILPALLLMFYLAYRLSYPAEIVLRRDFTGVQRLITQGEILWKYLGLAFFPNPASLGPFHDDHHVQRSLFDVTALLSATAWIIVISAAALLRRLAPLFAFAVGWYLFGHSLESSSIPLELYFEHRNYLPLLGPIYALIATLAIASRRWYKLVAISLIAYSMVLGGILFSLTSLWGSPALAAEMWYIYKPRSERAVQNTVVQLERDGDRIGARRVLTSFVARNPESNGLLIPILAITCQIMPETDNAELINQLKESLRTTAFRNGIMESIGRLYDAVEAGTCPSVSDDDVYELGQSLLDNPRFNSKVVRHNIHILMARIAMARRDLDSTMEHLNRALDLHPNTDTLTFMVGVLNSAGLYEESRQLLVDAEAWRPRHPILAAAWDRQSRVLESTLPDPGQSKTEY